MQLVQPLGAPCRREPVATLAIAVDLTGGEKSPVSERRRRSQRGEQCRQVGSRCQQPWVLKMNFLFFRNE